MKHIPTPYLHDVDGRGRRVVCGGPLEIVCAGRDTYVCCATCGRGWRHQWIYEDNPVIAGKRIESGG